MVVMRRWPLILNQHKSQKRNALDEDLEFWHGVSEMTLDAMGNNSEDDVYAQLLED